jgi:hypothetical protein
MRKNDKNAERVTNCDRQKEAERVKRVKTGTILISTPQYSLLEAKTVERGANVLLNVIWKEAETGNSVYHASIGAHFLGAGLKFKILGFFQHQYEISDR